MKDTKPIPGRYQATRLRMTSDVLQNEPSIRLRTAPALQELQS